MDSHQTYMMTVAVNSPLHQATKRKNQKLDTRHICKQTYWQTNTCCFNSINRLNSYKSNKAFEIQSKVPRDFVNFCDQPLCRLFTHWLINCTNLSILFCSDLCYALANGMYTGSWICHIHHWTILSRFNHIESLINCLIDYSLMSCKHVLKHQ